MDKIEFKKIIKQRRSILNITQKDISAISGLTLRKLIDTENVSANPTLHTLMKLIEALGLTIDVKVKT